MSQHQSPRSPRTPRSKSPSCDEGEAAGQENGPTADEIQVAVAEELNSPDRIISQAQQPMRSRGASPYESPPKQSFHGTASPSRTSYQGTAPQSRGSYYQSTHSRPPTVPQSRIPSPRRISNCEDEPPQQSSPPHSPALYESRATSLGASRAASPEGASQRSKPVSFQQMVQDQEQDDYFCPEDEARDDTYTRGPSQPSMRTPAASHPSMRGSPAYSHPSSRQTTSVQPSMREIADPSQCSAYPSMKGSPAYSHPSSRQTTSLQPSMREMADPSQCSAYPSMKGSPAYSRPSSRQTTSVQPSMREMADPSQCSNYPSMKGSPAYSRPSSRQTTSVQPSMREMADPSQCSAYPSMKGSPAYSQASGRQASSVQPSMREMADPSQSSAYPSMKGSAAYSQASARQGASVQPSLREMADHSQYSGYSSMREGASPSNRGTPGGSRSAAMGSPVGQSMVTFGDMGEVPSGIPGVGTSTSGMNPMGVDAATSAISYGSARSGALGSCIPGCKTFMKDIQNVPSSTPYNISNEPRIDASMDQRQSLMGSPAPRSGALESCIPGCTTFMKDIQNVPSSTPYNISNEPRIDASMDQRQSLMGSPAPRSGALGSCIPGCTTFMKDIQNVPSSTPYNISNEPRIDASMHQRQLLMGSPAPGSGRHPQYHRVHEMAKKTLPVPTSPTFDRTLMPSAYMRSMSPDDGEHHHHHHHDEGHEGPQERDERVVAALGHLSQFKKTPSYFRCGAGNDLDFMKICGATETETVKLGQVAAFPDIPCLRQEDLDELVKCEAADVESTWFLTSDERKTYKKPCPKQQKAQMSVKALVQAHEKAQTCGKEYSPLEHPDPEDISPEVAAAMMFSQERGIKLEECPNYTITSLFPDEPKAPFPDKIPASSISIVDRNSKDQEEMIEKSASVPSEGVSDSAYTRTMKEKGPEDMGNQRSFDVDFAIGQSKREYVLVTQKPQRVNKVQYRGGNSPPWFPGYFSAFPNEEGLKIVHSPSDLLHKAWIHSNPRNMPMGDVIVLD